MLSQLLQALDEAAHSTFDAIRTARRSLLLLTMLAVIGPPLAAGVSTLANLWTYQALQQAQTIARAQRMHASIDEAHDALRGHVTAAALLHRRSEGFEKDARDLDEDILGIQNLPLPPAIAARLRELTPLVQAYVASARLAMARPGGPTIEEVERLNTQWQALEEPLTRISEQLEVQMLEAERSGRRIYHNGNLLRAIGVLIVVGGILLAGRRISRAVLHTNRELAQATENARRASQSRADFLAAMSHEIRTPMTGVLGMVDLLAAEQLDPRQRRYVEGLRASGRHLLNVINDILDFTRIESGRLELERIDFSLPELLERVRSLVHPLAVEHGLALDMRLSPHSPPVLSGDPTRIQQVLLNLVGNAIKFTERGGVSVDVHHVPQEGPGLRYRFEVRDTGIGIPSERQADLFSAFRQADETIARRFGGSGLGLAICRRLVEAMGGTIGVQSAPGQGSTFFFELPLAIGDIERLGARSRTEHAPARPRRILVAEDVEINRHILGTTLERAGHQLAFAHDGAEALALARNQEFDLILMDVQMPVMDGLEATRRIRQLEGPNSRVPILALTANVMTQERERYLSAGMDDCLTKPIDWDQLFGAIERHALQRDPDAQAVERPTPAGPAPAATAPLVDDSVLASLEAMAGREMLRDWLQAGLRGYEASLEAMTQEDAAAATVAAEAHKLRGSGRTLGLPRIGALGTQIEEAAGSGRVPPGLVAQLGEALEASRGELKRRSLL